MMSNISMVEANLPPGFRFHPRDEELICDYLMKKVTADHHHHHHHHEFESPLLIEVDLNKSEPWDIPETACVGGKDWYFYSQRDRKYATGLRTNRATATGYWKATGKDRPILRKGSLVGMRKTLVFYQGRAPKGRKTDWVMHEFRLEGPFGPPKIPTTKEDWVLCRVFHKNKEASSAKSSMGTSSSCYEDTSSMSLPALTDSYINFNTNPNHNLADFEQVPCFSIFSQSQTSPNNMVFSSQFSNMDHHHHHQLPINTAMSSALEGVGGMAEAGNLDPFGSDKKVIKAVLDQYFKIESNNICNGAMRGSSTSCLGGDGSSESFLSDVGMPNMLNLY